VIKKIPTVVKCLYIVCFFSEAERVSALFFSKRFLLLLLFVSPNDAA
jgi:hypothetical protein